MNVCSFSGHRTFRTKSSSEINKILDVEIEKLISRGVTTFVSGGAVGFDVESAFSILNKKEKYPYIKLIMLLPCKNQDVLWNNEQKTKFNNLLLKADDVIFLQEKYTNDCMMKRNQRLIDVADVCLCALERDYSGTGQTVRMAKKKGIEVINILNIYD